MLFGFAVNCIQQRNAAHPADVHQDDQDDVGCGRKGGSDAQSQTYCTQCGGCLKKAFSRGNPVILADLDAARHKKQDVHQEDYN